MWDLTALGWKTPDLQHTSCVTLGKAFRSLSLGFLLAVNGGVLSALLQVCPKSQ